MPLPRGRGSRPPRGAARARTGATLWPLLGVLVVSALALVDLGAGFARGGPAAATNITGTFALAPALTGAGGTRRQTAAVGALAVAVGVLLVAVDGVHGAPAVARSCVVAAGALLATWVADVRTRHLAQLQDRREAARTLQAAMLTRLPRALPLGPHLHLELASRYLPASSGDQVGGDWYDALAAPGGGALLVVGDVTGHDVRAAASMGQVRAMLRAYAVDRAEPPAQVLARLERALQALDLDVLATAAVARVEAPGPGDAQPLLRWSSAGHPPPLLLHPGGAVEVLADEDPDLVLGVVPGTGRHDRTRALPAGATLLLCTDGLVERRGASLDEGEARLAAALARRAGEPLEALLDGVLADVLGGGPEDDVAVLAARVVRTA